MGVRFFLNFVVVLQYSDGRFKYNTNPLLVSSQRGSGGSNDNTTTVYNTNRAGGMINNEDANISYELFTSFFASKFQKVEQQLEELRNSNLATDTT